VAIWTAEGLGQREADLHVLGDLLLLGGMGEDDRAILVADVGPLAVHLGGVMHLEEILHERAVGDLGRIEGDLDDLGVTGALGPDLLVGGEIGLAAGIAADGGFDAGESWRTGIRRPRN